MCQPGTATCVLVDHVQISTATTGLRVLQTAVTGLSLTPEPDPATPGNTLAECYQLWQGTAWGNVVTADVEIAGEKAASVPIQIIATPNATPNAQTCPSNGFIRGDLPAGVQLLGANGVIGLGTLVQDCKQGACGSQYFSCNPNNGNCQVNVAAAPPVSEQVTNPVTMFASDKDGVIITLPSVDPAAGAPSGLAGTLTFGIGTQPNNAYNSAATALPAGPLVGAVTTTYTSQTAGSAPVQYTSLFDTGAVSYHFTDGGIAMCAVKGLATFYCPAAPLSLNATVAGSGGVGSAKVAFTVANAETLNSANPNSIAFSTLGSTPPANWGPGTFIWGLPFFFGRTVYIAYPSASVTGSGGAQLKGPFYAF